MEIVSNKPIDLAQIYDLIKKDTAGSVVLHFAIVRRSSESKITNSIEFQATRDIKDVERELRAISVEIHRKWQVEDVVIVRILGRLNIGDIISVVGVSSPHREEAFEACHHGIDRLKGMVTIVKKETFK
jgi:molybdopterin synthase catalytic subunit